MHRPAWLALLLISSRALCGAALATSISRVAAFSGATSLKDNGTDSAPVEGLQRPLMFVGIFSSLADVARRQEVRSSWMRHPLLRSSQASDSGIPRVVVRFVLGGGGGAICAPSSASEFAIVQAEGAEHRDIVVLPGECETKNGLPNKTISFFHWFSQTPESARAAYVMKLDDDTFPNLDLLAPLLREKIGSPNSYVGNMMWHGPMADVADAALPSEGQLYGEKEYPAYMAGSGYVLSADLAMWLDEVNLVEKRLKVLSHEDTTIGLFVHQENFMSIVANYVNVWSNVFGCEAGNFFAMRLVPGEMKCMWQKMMKDDQVKHYRAGEDMCCRPLQEHGLWNLAHPTDHRGNGPDGNTRYFLSPSASISSI